MCGLLFQSTLKIDMATVPYKGTAPAMSDLLGGQVDLMCDQTTNTTGQIDRKAIKAYAVTTTKRLTTPALQAADARRVRPEGLQRDHLARRCTRPRARPRPCSTRSTRHSRSRSRTPRSSSAKKRWAPWSSADGRVNAAEHKKFVEAEIDEWAPLIKAAGQYAD